MNSMRHIGNKSGELLRVVFGLSLLCFGLAESATAQFATPNINGVITAGEYGVHANGQNSYPSGSRQWLMTWDNANLYVGLTNANITEGAVIYIDTTNATPINSGGDVDGSFAGQTYDNTNFTQLPFRAEFVAYWRNGSREYRNSNGSNGWTGATTNFGSYADAGNVRELAIPWSAITGGGRPSAFNFFGYVTTAAGSVYGAAPRATTAEPGFIGVAARYERYFNVGNTNNGGSVLPFSRDCFVFNRTANFTNNTSLSVYDFTMNTPGLTWTLGFGSLISRGTVLVNAGTLDVAIQVIAFTNGGGGGATPNLEANQVILAGGTLQDTSLAGAGRLLLLDGNWMNNGGAFAPNDGRVTFRGEGDQTIGGSQSTNFARLAVSKFSGGELILATDTNVTANDSDTLRLVQGNINGALFNRTLTLASAANDAILGGGEFSYVEGKLQRQMSAGNDPYLWPVGTDNGFSPVTFSNLAGAGGMTVSATQTAQPQMSAFPRKLNRYWTLTSGGGITSADLNFQYLASDIAPADVIAEGSFNVFRIESGVTENVGGAVDPLAHTASVAGITSFSDWTAALDSPTAARLEEFAGYYLPTGNVLRWRSGYEQANLGFNVYRQTGREKLLLTPELVAGSALKFGAVTPLTAGFSYAWFDPEGGPASVYWLEDIDIKGERRMHGPVTVSEATGKLRMEVESVIPSKLLSQLPANNGAVFGYPATITPQPAAAAGSDAWQKQIQLAAGAAVKIGVQQTGWYRVNAAQLRQAGLPNDAESRFLQLYADGAQVPLLVNNSAGQEILGPDGTIEFYGVGLDTREADTRHYWLIAGREPGLRIGPPARVAPRGGEGENGRKRVGATASPDSALSPQPSALSFAYTVERKDRTIYAGTIRNGVAENFFGAVINNSPRAITMPISHLEPSSGDSVRVEVALYGAYSGPHRVSVALNGQILGEMAFNGQQRAVRKFNTTPNVLLEGENNLTLTALNGNADVSLVDTLKITYAHRYEAENDLLQFTSRSNRLVINGFASDKVNVFDITNTGRPIALATRVETDATGYAVQLNGSLRGRELYAVGEGRALAPAFVAANRPSSWTERERAADFVIITHENFRAALEPLANLRRAQGLRTEIISVNDIYDEWNGGAKSIEAVRQFLAWTRGHWATPPRYVLLAGDAGYDPRNYLGLGERDFVPTAFVDTAQFETASDEEIVDFDGDGIGEMSIGRLPLRATEQAFAVVNKIVGYAPPSGGALLVADRPEGFNFAGINRAAAGLLPGDTPVTEIDRASQSDAETRAAILAALNAGPSVVNYAGHASLSVWTGAGLLQSGDAANLTNGRRLPVMLMMSCLNGYFYDLTSDSLGESFINAPDGGAVAVWASSGLTFATGQAAINKEWFRLMYNPDAPAPLLGDAVRLAKRATNDREVRRTWILLGDPTLRIR